MDAADSGGSQGNTFEPQSNCVARRASHETLLEEADGHQGSDWTSAAAHPAESASRGARVSELDEEERRAATMFGGVVVALVLGMVVPSFVFSHYETRMVSGIINLLLGQSSRMWTEGLD